MDTTNNEPVEAEDVASPLDTSTVDTQPAETEEVADDNQSVEAEEASETLLAGKYKNPQELEKAYKELEGKMGEIGQKAELANLLEKQTGMNYQQIKEYIANQERQQLEEQARVNPGAYAYQEVQSLKQQLALQEEERKLDKFLNSEEGKPYQEFKEDIQEFAFLPKYHGKSYQEIAIEKFGKAITKGKEDAYKKIDTKRNTQATGVSQAPPKGKLTEEDMDKMSAEELAAVLPWADTSNRPY